MVLHSFLHIKSDEMFKAVPFFPPIPLPSIVTPTPPYHLALPFLRYLSWLAAALWCCEPLLHVVRFDSALVPTFARTWPRAQPEGEESCPKPHHQAWAGGWHCHGHACQYRDPWCRHELFSCEWCGVICQVNLVENALYELQFGPHLNLFLDRPYFDHKPCSLVEDVLHHATTQVSLVSMLMVM